MARCKECLHYKVCAKEGRLVQVDEHTWDDYNKLDDVEQFCTNYFTADVAPKSEVDWHREAELNAQRIIELEAELQAMRGAANSYKMHYENAKAEVAREIFAEIEKLFFANGVFIHVHSYNKLKKKYTEGKE